MHSPLSGQAEAFGPTVLHDQPFPFGVDVSEYAQGGIVAARG